MNSPLFSDLLAPIWRKEILGIRMSVSQYKRSANELHGNWNANRWFGSPLSTVQAMVSSQQRLGGFLRIFKYYFPIGKACRYRSRRSLVPNWPKLELQFKSKMHKRIYGPTMHWWICSIWFRSETKSNIVYRFTGIMRTNGVWVWSAICQRNKKSCAILWWKKS